jgi:uncharacterized repeat protein (TIGR03803 family)
METQTPAATTSRNRARSLFSSTSLKIALLLILAAAQFGQAQTYQVIYNFNGGATGQNPAAGMILDSNGNNLGRGRRCGRRNCIRAIALWFRMNLTPLHIFDWNPSQGIQGDGASPHAALVFGPEGKLYGTTASGGLPVSEGTVYQLSDGGGGWSESVLYRFKSNDDGIVPQSSVTFDQAGNMYGTTSNGGTGNRGTVYELSPVNGGWQEKVLWSFGISLTDGEIPFGNVVLDDAGNLYGTTVFGGARYGTVFELVPSGSDWKEKTLHTFQLSTDGGYSEAGLTPDSAGNLYGTTSAGGPNGGGTVFELTPSGGGWDFHVIYAFSWNGEQTGPFGGVTFDSEGNLLGTTYAEGNGVGSVFKLTRSGNNWVYSDLHDFDETDGAYPQGNLVLDSSGNVYGTTVAGGTGTGCAATCGVAFEINP